MRRYQSANSFMDCSGVWVAFAYGDMRRRTR